MDTANILMQLGLTIHEARVYELLLKTGISSPVSLSRKIAINRTTLYRILESLEAKGLVKRIVESKSTSFEAAPAETLTNILIQKENDLKTLQNSLTPLVKSLSQLQSQTDSPTKVKYYQGQSGLRQLLWNTLNAKTEVVGLGWADWNAGIGRKYAEIIRGEVVERQIYHRELLNEDQIDDTFSFTDNQIFISKFYRHRILPKKVLKITQDTYIYNNVFAFYHIYKGEHFGVEIYNAHIAATEYQIFNILWQQAKVPQYSPVNKYPNK
ncbi:hypothetical protein A2154_01800 [Candidatus Gottesmanbacteria bacterium RBG_16_43_7]|uniref:Transcription regulator TrmB N-terminal domain-containing protein n=1 Tax=Candidatus Gottesmanbacteria bacterium RBG_16_43_7 TaxID=1798373 RepID=A0A1F5Z944_9BACT|nr:MAG: hypothetical protein A2154_01800 [Candidatus Gottesmanbacteria bacterium RBG_16_43_7]